MRFHISFLIFILGKVGISLGQIDLFSDSGHPNELALLVPETVEMFSEEPGPPLDFYDTETIQGPTPLASDELDPWLLDSIEPVSDSLPYADINTSDAGDLFNPDNTGTPQYLVDASDECSFNYDLQLPGKLRARGPEKCRGNGGGSPPFPPRPDFSNPFKPDLPLSDHPLDFPYINSASDEDREVFQRKWCSKRADELASLPVCSSGKSEDVKLSLFFGKVDLENCALCMSNNILSVIKSPQEPGHSRISYINS